MLCGCHLCRAVSVRLCPCPRSRFRGLAFALMAGNEIVSRTRSVTLKGIVEQRKAAHKWVPTVCTVYTYTDVLYQ